MKVSAQYFTNKILRKSKEVEKFLLIKLDKIEVENRYELEKVYKEAATRYNNFWGKLGFKKLSSKDIENMYNEGLLSTSEHLEIFSQENEGDIRVLIETEKLSKIRDIIKVCETTESREILLDEEAVKLVFNLGV